jgi:TonB family protein
MATGMHVPRIADRKVPLTAMRLDMSGVRPSSPIRELPQAGTIADTGLFPRPQDILGDIPGSDESAQARPQSSGSIEPSGNPASQAERIGWNGQGRKLIRRRDPGFPQSLSASGQEVECEARIIVAPNGNVVHVEITKSSGYTEVDASVESALRDYLFSRGETRKEAVGTIRFRFRLEKRD